jgi:hypothetical protein
MKFKNQDTILFSTEEMVIAKTGKICMRKTFINHLLNSIDDEPSTTYWHYDNVNKTEFWHLDNVLHRDKGPAYVEYTSSKNIVTCERYFRKGKLHRLNGPALIDYDNNGNVMFMDYFFDGEIYVFNKDIAPLTWLFQQHIIESYLKVFK